MYSGHTEVDTVSILPVTYIIVDFSICRILLVFERVGGWVVVNLYQLS